MTTVVLTELLCCCLPRTTTQLWYPDAEIEAEWH